MSENDSTTTPRRPIRLSDGYARVPADRVIAAVSKVRGSASEDECWMWKRGVRRDRPYGFLYYFYKGKRAAIIPSKASFIAHGGKTPEPGEVVMHSCDNPPCVNPRHLSLGTHRQNMIDAAKKNRIVKSPRLHAFTVVAIRSLFAEGVSMREISIRLNLPRNTVLKIARGEVRKSIQPME